MASETIKVGLVDTKHPEYDKLKKSWTKIRDCISGEDTIKGKTVDYLPRPSGMSGDYADAYDGYIERAHFPLITSYALAGALGVVITKLPEFNVPSKLNYILKTATKDGKSLSQLFLDMVIEIFQTGRSPLLIDVISSTNEFRFVQYKAEEFINWKTAVIGEERKLILGVLTETQPTNMNDIFSHETDEIYRVLFINEYGQYSTVLYNSNGERTDIEIIPNLRGKPIFKIPLTIAGSINNSFEAQPVPLIAVANCSIQIYRKEADLANSEYLSCNPTLCIVGATNDEDLPNVVGSSVMIVLPNEQARIFYTQTDTAALQHVKQHIESLYEEAIRHGVAILDARKGVEAAESLRIRQSTQSASVYSIYLSAMNAIKEGLEIMCEWAGYNKEEIILDAPSSLTQGIPDSSLLKELFEGYLAKVVPLPVIHRYMVYSGLLDQKIGYEEYLDMLKEIPENVGKDENSLTLTDKEGKIITISKSNKRNKKGSEGSEGPEDQI